jgi:hypothetical protein
MPFDSEDILMNHGHTNVFNMDDNSMPLLTTTTPLPTSAVPTPAVPTPDPTPKPTDEPNQAKKRKTSEYNIFRKYLVSKGHRLAQKDVGLRWSEVNKPSSAGTKSLWQRARNARTEGADPTNASKRLNSDEGFLRYLQRDGTFNDEVKSTLQQRFSGLADSTANDILDGSTDAQTVIKPTFDDGKDGTTPINDPFLDSISNIVSGGGAGSGVPGSIGMKRTNDGYVEQATRGSLIRNAGGGTHRHHHLDRPRHWLRCRDQRGQDGQRGHQDLVESVA